MERKCPGIAPVFRDPCSGYSRVIVGIVLSCPPPSMGEGRAEGDTRFSGLQSLQLKLRISSVPIHHPLVTLF